MTFKYSVFIHKFHLSRIIRFGQGRTSERLYISPLLLRKTPDSNYSAFVSTALFTVIPAKAGIYFRTNVRKQAFLSFEAGSRYLVRDDIGER